MIVTPAKQPREMGFAYYLRGKGCNYLQNKSLKILIVLLKSRVASVKMIAYPWQAG